MKDNHRLLEIINGSIGSYDYWCEGSQRHHYLCAITLSCSRTLKKVLS